MNKILNFFKESYSELKKVVWPGSGEVSSSTRVVIVSTLLFALILGIVDFLLIVGIDIIF
ncbi:MAG: preprotein translocase subunit SecE [Spirochaetales bacterium]|jgi:preprotein translocase subunit SecE|nr:preprotein translocase subunit SecE [Spirochaetales bacterium]